MTPRQVATGRGAPATWGPSGPAGRRPGGTAGRRPTAAHPARPADVERLAWAFATLYLEVEAARRPAAQLRALMSPRLYARIVPVWVRSPLGAQLGTALTMTGMRVGERRYEAVVVVRRGDRVGALGLELVHSGGRWRVEDASRPEDGVLPEPAWVLPEHEPDSFDTGRGGVASARISAVVDAARGAADPRPTS